MGMKFGAGEEQFHNMIEGLFLLLIFLLLLALYLGSYGLARIYNWNGKRYCYIGAVPIRKRKDAYTVHIGERMVDLSHTTAYRICPGRAFCRKNRYRGMVVYADKSSRYLIIGQEPMKTEIPI